MASSRFPGKPLCDLAGKPMIQWVYEAAIKSQVSDEVVIATPDQEILDAAKAFGAPAIRTSIQHPSGTDRIAEVAQSIKAEYYVNVQGDEPLILPENIAACAAPLGESDEILMGSLYTECADDEIENPAVVKVVVAQNGNALYFSRCPIPYPRNPRLGAVNKHVGLYAYRRDVLERYATWRQTPLESTESLEQLRFLENGVPIRMSKGKPSLLAVDTPEQAEEVRRIILSGGYA